MTGGSCGRLLPNLVSQGLCEKVPTSNMGPGRSLTKMMKPEGAHRNIRKNADYTLWYGDKVGHLTAMQDCRGTFQ